MSTRQPFRHAFAIVLLPWAPTFFLVGCAESDEQSISFHEDYLKQQVARNLESSGIPFRQERNTIWYSVDDSEVVKNVFNEAVANRPLGYIFYEKERRDRFIALLDDQGIIASSDSRDGPPYVVNVPVQHRDQAGVVFQEILRGD